MKRFAGVGGVFSTLLAGAVLLVAGGLLRGEAFIVENGEPRSEIVIGENAPRMTKLAAEELQNHIKKISGAELPVVTTPSEKIPVKIYVGKSDWTDELGIGDEGLGRDAFKMISGDDYLVLLGHDEDFVPPPPHLAAHGKANWDRALKEWDAKTGEKWSLQHWFLFKGKNRDLGVWEYDQRGSLLAVYEFLRKLGVRWYMPGDLGEIIPKRKTIVLPEINETVKPDFAVRNVGMGYNPYFYMDDKEFVLWHLRMGFGWGEDVTGLGSPGHGINNVHARDEIKESHPEWYKLANGKRATGFNRDGAPCLSSPELFDQNVRFVRYMFDVYDEPMVNVMPTDAYAGLCECPLCAGKETPERGYSGQLSDYVWDYVNRVAARLLETNPKKKICCFAYGTYQQPPLRIAKLNPNIVLGMCHGRRAYGDPKAFEKAQKTRKEWLQKLPSGKFLFWNYYLTSRPGGKLEHVPVFFPHVIAKDLRSMKDFSVGEHVELTRTNVRNLQAPGYNHLNAYVNGRMLWDVDQDVDRLLDEYYENFYGPAAEEMKAFIEYSEAHWQEMTKDPQVINEALALLTAARGAAGDGVCEKRVNLLWDYVNPLEQLRDRLAIGRKNVPEIRCFVRDPKDLKLDGKLDESFWKGVWGKHLRELRTGREPDQRTWVQVAWAADAMIFGIKCEERDVDSITSAGKRRDDMNVFLGDAVELLVETQANSYYQIAITPDGVVADFNRENGKFDDLWTSHAEVATHVGDGFWSMEVRLPVAGDMAKELDAANGVAGRKPSETFPWHVNVCRQRVRGSETQLSAVSPTGTGNFHELLKFAKLVIK